MRGVPTSQNTTSLSLFNLVEAMPQAIANPVSDTEKPCRVFGLQKSINEFLLNELLH